MKTLTVSLKIGVEEGVDSDWSFSRTMRKISDFSVIKLYHKVTGLILLLYAQVVFTAC